MRWWLLLGMIGCDDGRGHGGLVELLDAARPVDARMHDARPVDAQIRDAQIGDARVVDQGPRVPDAAPADRGPEDARLADAARPVDVGADARVDAALDAAAVDAEVDAAPPPPCVGIVLPPPPESPDGSEVCNYRDDDGDGLVDEGFAYDFLGAPVRITEEPQVGPGDLRLVWAEDGYGAVWDGPRGFRFVKLAPTGCPTSPLVVTDTNPDAPHLPSSLMLAYNNGRFAATFTEQRLVGGPDVGVWGTFVQLFEQDGTPVGQPIDIEPRLSHRGFNAIVPYQDGFAVFSNAYHPERGGVGYSSFVILDRDGRIVLGPSHPYDALPDLGQAMHTFVGMAFDGEGFGMAWFAVGVWFMRWAPNGEVLLPPVQPLELRTNGRGSGIAWDGQRYVIPTEYRPAREVRLTYLAPNGEPALWSPAVVGQYQGGGQTMQLEAWDGGVVHYGAYNGLLMTRLDGQGVPASPPFQVPLAQSSRLDFWAVVPGLPVGAVGVLDDNPEVQGDTFIAFSQVGCSGR